MSSQEQIKNKGYNNHEKSNSDYLEHRNNLHRFGARTQRRSYYESAGGFLHRLGNNLRRNSACGRNLQKRLPEAAALEFS